MSDPVHPVTRYTVAAKFEITVKASTRLTFTDEDVREWADLEDDGEAIDPELIDEYMREALGESDVIDVYEVTDWSPLGAMDDEFTFVKVEKTMSVPPEFVPLPGMEDI